LVIDHRIGAGAYLLLFLPSTYLNKKLQWSGQAANMLQQQQQQLITTGATMRQQLDEQLRLLLLLQVSRDSSR